MWICWCWYSLYARDSELLRKETPARYIGAGRNNKLNLLCPEIGPLPRGPKDQKFEDFERN